MYGKILQLTKTAIIPMFIVTILVISPLQVRGDFTEDFTSPSPDWQLYAQNNPDWTNSSWSITNGILNSSATTISYDITNQACHYTGYDNGLWEFDFYGPDIPFVVGFRISVDPDFVTGGEEGEGSPHWVNPSLTQVIVKVGVSPNLNLDNSLPYININQKLTTEALNLNYRVIGENTSVADDLIRGWHHVQIEKNDTYVRVYLDQIIITEGALWEIYEATYDWICLWTNWGVGTAFDNIMISDLLSDPNPNDPSDDGETDFPQTVMIASIGFISVIAVSFGGRSYLKKKQIRKALELKKFKLEAINTVNHEFELSDLSIYSLIVGANKADDYYSDERFKELVPNEILTYRYLLHPIRLTIMKVLNSEEHMRSADIKHLLDISWSEYSNHIKSLEKNGYVEIMNEFSDQGNVVQVVYILEFGRKQFELLFGLLQQFVAKSSPFEYLIYAKANLKDPGLYPDKSELE